MAKTAKTIFTSGKEELLKKTFATGSPPIFGYVALGYAAENEGFETPSDFQELEEGNNYTERKPLSLYGEPEVDPDTGKVLVRFSVTIDENVLTQAQPINQIAVVDTKTIGADTTYYCATTFQTFTKTSNSSITFVIGFRI